MDRASAALMRLVEIMARLRNPDGGCPWDLEQTHQSLAPYAIEEAYEVADAAERGDLADLRDELGDLLLQVVFHAQVAREAGGFDFADVAESVAAKMIRRHPHVFADAVISTASEQTASWEAIKENERHLKTESYSGILSDVPIALPALTRAVKLSRRAARVGFAWPTVAEIMAKLDEETEELRVEIEAGDIDKAADELGDLLFVCANIARHLEIEPETALRAANAKFTRRFQYIEQALARKGQSPVDAGLAEMGVLWDEAKAAEIGGRSA